LKKLQFAALHPGQQVIVESGARFKVLACGRRFGKTTIAVEVICNRVIEGESVAYFAPTFRMAADVWREVKARLYPLTKDVREHEWRLETRMGGVFECWSLANQAAETVRGRMYHYVVMDEAALFESGDVWQAAIRPLLTDTSGGALFCSTPRGRNWFWHLYQQGMSEDYPDWEAWRFPTSISPYIKVEEIEAARWELPERVFQQEYEAMFHDDGGAVFRNVEGVCTVIPAGSPLHAHAAGGEATYYFGVDWGKDRDFTCVSVMTHEGKQVWLERFNQVGWAVQRGRLAALYEQFKPHTILAEENSIGSVNIEALRNEELPIRGFVTTAKSKGPLIEELVLALEKSEVALLKHPTLMHELMAYEMKRTRYGWQYSAPPGGHDDTVMATALSLRAIRSGWVMWAFV
jgi:hypothetical protein